MPRKVTPDSQLEMNYELLTLSSALIGSDEESGGEDIPFRDSKAVANDEEEEDEGEEGEDGEEDEDEYVIETITEHMIDEEGVRLPVHAVIHRKS